MPLTLEQRKKVVELSGYDPNTHDYDETTDYIIPKSPTFSNPTPTTEINSSATPQKQEETTKLEALGYNALSSLGPTAAGLVVGKLGSMLPTPAGKILGSIGGALGGAYGFSKYIEPNIETDAFKQRLAQTQQEHPILSPIGQYLPAAAAFNPIEGIKNIPKIPGAIGRLTSAITRGAKVNPSEDLNLISNLGLNLGVAGGQNVASQLQGNQPFSLKDLALGTLPAALLTEPYGYTKRFLGGKVPTAEIQPPMEESAGTTPTFGNLPLPPREQMLEYLKKAQNISEPYYPEKVGNIGISESESGSLPKRPILEDLTGETKVGDEAKVQQEELQKQKESNKQFLEEQTKLEESRKRTEDFNNSQEELQKQRLEEAKLEADLEAQRIKNLNDQRKIDLAIGNKTGITPELSPAERLKAQIESNRLKETRPGIERLSEQSKIESDHPLIKEAIEEAGTVPTKEASYQAVREPGIKLAAKRNIPIISEGEPLIRNGKEVQGVYNPENNSIKIGSAEVRGGDVFGHEVSHGFVKQLLASKNPKDINLANRAKNILGGEEPLADFQGVKSFTRMLQESKGLKRDQLNSWWKDFLSNVKDKTGISNDKDILRLLNARMHYDYPGTEYSNPQVISPGGQTKEEIQPSEKSSLSTHQQAILDNLNKRPEVIVKDSNGKGYRFSYDGDMDFTPIGKGKIAQYTAKEPNPFVEQFSTTNADTLTKKGAQIETKTQEKANESNSQEPKTIKERSVLNATDTGKIEGSILGERKTGNASGKASETSSSDSLQRTAKEETQRKDQERLSKESKLSEGDEVIKGIKGDLAKKLMLESKETPQDKKSITDQLGAINTPELQSKNSKLRSIAPFLTAQVDKIRSLGPEGEYASDAINKFKASAEFESSYISESLISLAKGLNEEQKTKLNKYLYEVSNKGKSLVPLDTKTKNAANDILKFQNDFAKRLATEGPSVGSRATKADYWPSIIRQDVVSEWNNNPNSKESKHFDKLYLDYAQAKGLTPEDAQKYLNAYKSGFTFRGRQATSNLDFGDIRESERLGLPFELTEKSFDRVAQRYGRKAGSDLSYFKYIQSDPKMQKILNLKDQYGQFVDENKNPQVKSLTDISRNPEVMKLMENVYGIDDYSHNPTITSTSRLVTNFILGPATAARNLASIPGFIAPYIRASQLPEVFKAIGEISNRWEKAKLSGAVKTTYRSFDVPQGDIEGTMNRWQEFATKASDFLRKYQGRNLSDNLEGAFYYSLGEELANSNIKINDNTSKKFLERFGELVPDLQSKIKSGKFSSLDISKIAKSFVDATRGTYDFRQLPDVALRGQVAPFLSLSRFNLGKSNVIARDVIAPAINGNYGPLLKYIGASLGVGYGIEKLNELISGKRPSDANTEEALKEGQPIDKAEKVIDLLQLASFVGIGSDFAKTAIRLGRGKDIRYSSPVSFPLYSFVSDSLGGNISDAVKAINDGADPIDTLSKLVVAIGSQSNQALRTLNNYYSADDTSRKNMYRDFRVFEELRGYKEPEREVTKGNEFANIEEKKFKRTTDIGEAANLLPGLFQKAFENSKGNPELLKQELLKLKLNNYQTMPNIESYPIKFFDYFNYLKNTQGDEEASSRLSDYLLHKELNKVKTRIIPTIH